MSENKKTKIKIFMKLFNDIKDRDAEKEIDKKEKFISKYIENTYMPYAIKIAEAKRIVDRTTNIDVDGKKMYAVSSPMRWALYVMSVITFYTSLEFDTDAMTDFDLLDASGAIEMIFAAIGKDVDTFNTVLNMTMDDYINNERDVVSFLENKFMALGELLSAIDIDAIENAMRDNN